MRTAHASLVVRDELEQRPVGIAKVDAPPLSSRAEAPYWPKFDCNTVICKVGHGVVDLALPHKAQVGPARCDGRPCVRCALDSRTVDVQLVRPEAIREAGAGSNDVGA